MKRIESYIWFGKKPVKLTCGDTDAEVAHAHLHGYAVKGTLKTSGGSSNNDLYNPYWKYYWL